MRLIRFSLLLHSFSVTQTTATEWSTEPTTESTSPTCERRTRCRSRSSRFPTSRNSTSSRSKAFSSFSPVRLWLPLPPLNSPHADSPPALCRQSGSDLLRRSSRPRRCNRSSQTSSQDLVTRHFLQSWSMPRSHSRLRRQVGFSFEYDQDARTDRHCPRWKEATCASKVLAREQRVVACLQGTSRFLFASQCAPQADPPFFLVPQEFYIPTESSSVHFLKSKLCVGCTKGFEIVDLETLDTQGLLDPADSSLDFVQKRENARPIAIYRIDGEFLLCYDGESTFAAHSQAMKEGAVADEPSRARAEFAFYVNKNGWRAKANWIIQWEGFPTTFGTFALLPSRCDA